MTDEDCAACEFNRPGKTCLRTMEWVWRGETFSATASEYYSLKAQLQVRQAVAGEYGQRPGGTEATLAPATAAAPAAAAAAAVACLCCCKGVGNCGAFLPSLPC